MQQVLHRDALPVPDTGIGECDMLPRPLRPLPMRPFTSGKVCAMRRGANTIFSFKCGKKPTPIFPKLSMRGKRCRVELLTAPPRPQSVRPMSRKSELRPFWRLYSSVQKANQFTWILDHELSRQSRRECGYPMTARLRYFHALDLGQTPFLGVIRIVSCPSSFYF